MEAEYWPIFPCCTFQQKCLACRGLSPGTPSPAGDIQASVQGFLFPCLSRERGILLPGLAGTGGLQCFHFTSPLYFFCCSLLLRKSESCTLYYKLLCSFPRDICLLNVISNYGWKNFLLYKEISGACESDLFMKVEDRRLPWTSGTTLRHV